MNSKRYWEKRETEALKRYLTDEKEYDRRVKEIYQSQADAIQEQIDAFYGRYAAKEGISIAEAKKRVSKVDIAEYERKAAKYVAEKNFSDKANAEMRLYNATMRINRLELLKAKIGLELVAGHDELEKYMAGILKGRTIDELKRQAGILGETVRGNVKVINAIVNASFRNATFSDRIWMYQDLLKNRLSGLLQSGLIQGKNPRELARELVREFGVSTSNAERLMRTELARVQTEAQKQSFEANGFTMYTFHANSGCCPHCQALDGQHFQVKDMMPGTNAAPLHPNCRCSVSAYEDSEEYEAWLDYLDKGGTTKEWNRRIKINLPGSTKSYKRSLLEIAAGKAGLDKRRKNILAQIRKPGEYHRYSQGEISIRDLSYLSAATGHEFALFRSKREDILVRGDSKSCNIVGEIGEEILNKHYKWIAHSHVDGGVLAASIADRKTLERLHQASSVIVGIDGEETTFHQSLFED